MALAAQLESELGLDGGGNFAAGLSGNGPCPCLPKAVGSGGRDAGSLWGPPAGRRHLLGRTGGMQGGTSQGRQVETSFLQGGPGLLQLSVPTAYKASSLVQHSRLFAFLSKVICFLPSAHFHYFGPTRWLLEPSHQPPPCILRVLALRTPYIWLACPPLPM